MKFQVLAVVAFCFSFLFATAQKNEPAYQAGAIWLKLKPSEEVNTPKKEKLTIDDVKVLKPLKVKYKLKNLEKPFRKMHKANPLQDTYYLQFDQVEEADKLIKELEGSGVLEYAEKVPLNTVSAVPNDYSSSSLWHLAKIKADVAWGLYANASNTVIAIVDDAVQTNHPDLAANIWTNTGEIAGNGIDDDNNGYIDDVNGWDFADWDNNPNPTAGLDHGTHVAGIASAATNNNVGIASIGSNAKLMCVKSSNQATKITNGYEGIIYAADNGAHVINLSWGGYGYSVTAKRIIDYALDKGCIIVAAAGNDNVATELYPAAYEGVISVAATDNNDVKGWYSNYGTWITVSAPGTNIFSTTVGSGYGNNTGTSMASPLVAGLVALMHSYNPTISRANLIGYLKSTADNIDAANASYTGKLGAGRINAGKAMQAMLTTTSLPATADFSSDTRIVPATGTVHFIDLSSYASSLSWSFPGGIPATSTQKSPAVVYNTPGTYNVSLTVTNANGSGTETKNGYITVRNCVQVNDPVPTNWSEVSYSFRDAADEVTGWVTGVNEYGDKQKAMFFDASATSFVTYITKVKVKFGGAYSEDVNKTVSLNILDGTNDSPGDLIRSVNVTMGQIMTDVNNNDYTTVEFTSPVPLPASKKYFVSVDLSNLYSASTIDPLFIWSNDHLETVPTTVWEQWSDDSWHRFDEPYMYGLSIALYIHPYLTDVPTIAQFTPSVTSACTGNTVSFDAAGSTYQTSLNWTFPGATPSSVSGNPSPSVMFNTPGKQQVTLTVQGGGCDDIRSATMAINVNATVTPSVTLASNSSAPSTQVTFTATATNGGINPQYVFKRNGYPVQTGTSNTLQVTNLKGGDVVTCTLTSDIACVTKPSVNSNSITMDVLMTLPVELMYFKGEKVNGNNLLQWATASESNTDRFVIERSADGASFVEIGFVKAKGESNTILNYNFTDPIAAPAYYRLKPVDLDGSSRLSKVIYLNSNQNAGIKLWPNPASQGQEINILSSGIRSKLVRVQVMDVLGKTIDQRTFAVRSGKLESNITTGNFKPGVYFITVKDETNKVIQHEKLLIAK